MAKGKPGPVRGCGRARLPGSSPILALVWEGESSHILRCIALFLTVTVLICFLAKAAGAAEPLRLGIYPLLEVTEVVRRFTPLARYLEEATGRKVEIEVAKDYQDHVDKTGADAYDLSYMGPASYIQMTAKYGLKPILARLETNKAPTYRGAIIAAGASGLANLGDLKGRRFAFGDKGSTMGYVVPCYMLWKAGIGLEDLAGYDFLKNQEDVALSVLAGHFDGGAVREQVYEQYVERGLRVLAWSPPLSEHLFVANNTLPPALVEKLRNALYRLSAAPGGKEIMQAIQRSVTAFIPAQDSDYASLRGILGDLERNGIKP